VSTGDHGPGDYWLVFSARVHMQARLAPDAISPGEGLFVRAVAAGGPFLGGGTAVVGCLADAVTWRGREVLASPTGDWAAFAPALVSEFEDATVKMNQSSFGRVTAVLPSSVLLKVNRRHGHVNLAITMPPQQADAGQDGLCGNFNSVAGDDTVKLLTERFDPMVRRDASLFY